jgi:hypothetical protein
VVWEERQKPCCRTCCTDENHPWFERVEFFDTLERARSREDELYGHMDSLGVEQREILVQKAEVEWEECY